MATGARLVARFPAAMDVIVDAVAATVSVVGEDFAEHT